MIAVLQMRFVVREKSEEKGRRRDCVLRKSGGRCRRRRDPREEEQRETEVKNRTMLVLYLHDGIEEDGR
jgi:hypothetical protein